MSPNLRIALRFLLARKRSMLMSLAGIVFGVGFFIVTQAQTSGFEEFFIETIIGTDGAIVIDDKQQDTIRSVNLELAGGASLQFSDPDTRRFIPGIEHPRQLREALGQFPNVSGFSEVVKESVTVFAGAFQDSGQVYGINLAEHLGVSNLENQILFGSMETFRENPYGIIIGRGMSERLQVSVDENLILEARGERQRFRVEAVFETGNRDIDKARVYVHLSAARSLLHKPFGATFLQVSLFDRERAELDAEEMTRVLSHKSVAWQTRERIWLGVFRALRFSSALTVVIIILISGLGMFNTLAMIVMEKTREISILRSMGYTRDDISQIFLWQGGLVLAAGTVLGWLMGAIVTYAVSLIPITIRGIFATDTFVVSWSIWHYVTAAVLAVVIVMIASLIPARRAARLEPGDVIRGTAT